MPVKTWDTKEDFDGAYRIRLTVDGIRPGIDSHEYGHYERRALFNDVDPRFDYFTPEWSRILAHFAWHKKKTSILIVGCGFGWALEYLDAQGFTDIWGTDTSTHIQTTKDLTDSHDDKKFAQLANKIQNTDIVHRSQVNALLKLADHDSDGGFDVIITERVLSSLTDEETQLVSQTFRFWDMVKPTGTVVHIETDAIPGRKVDPGFNWHTLEEWKVLLPNDTFVRSGGSKVI